MLPAPEQPPDHLRNLVVRHAAWIPDLFAALALELGSVTHRIVSESWAGLGPEDVAALKQCLEASERGEVPDAVRVYLCDGVRPNDGIQSTWSWNQRAFLVACAIDQALEPLHPSYRHCDAGTLSHGMRAIRDHFVEYDVYSRPTAPAIVIPKAVTRRIPGTERGDRLLDCFIFVIAVVPEIIPTQFRIQYGRIPRDADFLFGTAVETLDIAVVPVAETRDDIAIDMVKLPREKRLRFRIAPEREKKVAARVRSAMRLLPRSQPTVVVLPEFVTSDVIREAVRQELRKPSSKGKATPPALVAAGSGLRNGYSEVDVYDAWGNVLWTQRKLHHNVVNGDDAVKLGVEGAEITAEYREDFHSGTDVHVMDSNIGRLVVLICEDFNQSEPAKTVFDRLRPDWVLVPVLDKDLKKDRWYHRRACEAAERHEARSIIGNSLAFGMLRGGSEPFVEVSRSGTIGGFTFGLLVERGLQALTLALPTPGPVGKSPGGLRERPAAGRLPRFAVARWTPDSDKWPSRPGFADPTRPTRPSGREKAAGRI